MDSISTRQKPRRSIELLAPAGDYEAGLAAFHYGADAVYLGLKQFSARADAGNFTPDELEELTSYAHSLTPRRKVFVAVNTLVKNDELPFLVEALDAASHAGVDAVIVQDAGVVRVVQRWFPELALHASTQMAIHNIPGVMALAEKGFQRITLARELTVDEIRELAIQGGVELEVFIHGALCYSYSGLCLYSSLLRGRSGNRGRCAYPCRSHFQCRDGRDAGFPFSMKDLALGSLVDDLVDAGIQSLKVEGRKKSALYVAVVTALYRGILDHRLSKAEQDACAADLQTVFSRPWTSLYFASRQAREVIDHEVVGHRGARIGDVARVRLERGGRDRLCFQSARSIERHDGLQVDLAGVEKAYGFAVDELFVVAGRNDPPRRVVTAPAGSRVEVELPPDHPPIPAGAPLYCSSSQAVKRSYRFERPRPGVYRLRHPVAMTIHASKDRLELDVRMPARYPGEEPLRIQFGLDGPFTPCRDKEEMDKAVRRTFARLGETSFMAESLSFDNAAAVFVPVSALNRWRREIVEQLTAVVEEGRKRRLESIIASIRVPEETHPTPVLPPYWAIKTDRLACLAGMTASEWRDIAEVTIDISVEPWPEVRAGIETLAGAIGRDRIRLALPILARGWELSELQRRTTELRSSGWTRWEIGNSAGLTLLRADGSKRPLDLSADWSMNVLNRQAVLLFREWGIGRCVLSPEDDLANQLSLIHEFGSAIIVPVFQDTPLLISETCPWRDQDCQGKCCETCDRTNALRSDDGEEVLVVHSQGRTITLNSRPFGLTAEQRRVVIGAGAGTVRLDFVWRVYSSGDVLRICRSFMRGENEIALAPGNVKRGFR